MLGCQDFCGHYEWTFHYFRSRWGQDAVRRFWAEAIGGESQQHYAEVALQAGLRGLYDQYVKTGEEEHCDWTYTLDESKNCLAATCENAPAKDSSSRTTSTPTRTIATTAKVGNYRSRRRSVWKLSNMSIIIVANAGPCIGLKIGPRNGSTWQPIFEKVIAGAADSFIAGKRIGVCRYCHS